MIKPRIKVLPLVFALLVSAELQLGEPVCAGEFQLPPPDHYAPLKPYLSAARVTYHDGSFVGPVTSSYYGDVQVKVTIAGGKIVAVVALQFPSDRSTSRRINAVALPRLQSEVIQAQSARVNTVTGATVTSEAYLTSLTRALEAASA